MKKYLIAVITACLLCLLLTGCADTNGSGLYKLPAVTRDYVDLQARIEEILGAGAEYCAPLTGTNRQSVQLVDLNGDGIEEAVAFFKNGDEEKPLKVYIFSRVQESYETAAIIEADGTAFDTIEYAQLDMDGFTEILVGTRINSETPQVMNVYSLNGFYPTLMGQMTYTGYTLCDLDTDGMQELITASYTASAMTGKVASYAYEAGAMVCRGEAPLSEGISVIKTINTGKLSDGAPAVFLTSLYGSAGNITDIIAINRGQLKNITMDRVTGCSSATVGNTSIPVEDINGDGVTEVPRPEQVTDTTGDYLVDGCYRIVWKAYSSTGRSETASVTFHNMSEGWYLDITGFLEDDFCANRVNSTYGTRCTTLFRRDSSENTQEILRIYVLTGDNRYSRLNSTDSFLLRVKDVTVYAGKMVFIEGLTAEEAKEQLIARFSLSRSAWYTGEVNK